jgi:outer membrane protein OmpA-like peptidoglycan-associated protein
VVALTLAIAASVSPRAQAQPLARHRLHVAAGAALSVRAHDDRDDFGAHAGIGYELMLARAFGLEITLDAAIFPYDSENFAGAGYGMYSALGFGPRVHLLPSRRIDLSLHPALDAVRTGDLTRLGLRADLGLEIAVSDSLALGPRLTYAHVLQPNGHALGSEDGRFVALDLAITWGHDAFAREPVPEPVTPIATVVPDLPEPEPVPVVEPLPEPVPVVETPPAPVERPLSSTPSFEARIGFTAGSAMLRDSAVRELRRVRELLLSTPSIVTVRVVGHADEVGGEGLNDSLSELRARAVVDWLVAHGIEASRFDIVGVGAREPVIPGRTEAARRANRRVLLFGFERVDAP